MSFAGFNTIKRTKPQGFSARDGVGGSMKPNNWADAIRLNTVIYGALRFTPEELARLRDYFTTGRIILPVLIGLDLFIAVFTHSNVAVLYAIAAAWLSWQLAHRLSLALLVDEIVAEQNSAREAQAT